MRGYMRIIAMGGISTVFYTHYMFCDSRGIEKDFSLCVIQHLATTLA